jgi:hypothetical protein
VQVTVVHENTTALVPGELEVQAYALGTHADLTGCPPGAAARRGVVRTELQPETA